MAKRPRRNHGAVFKAKGSVGVIAKRSRGDLNGQGRIATLPVGRSQ